MGPYIVKIFFFTPSKLLGIVDGTCVGKCSTPWSFSSKWKATNKALVPILCQGWGVGHKISPIFSKTKMKYSQSNSRCVGQSKFFVWCNFNKLSKNILDILGHDVKLCDWIPIFIILHLDLYELHLHLLSLICIQNTCKILHVIWI